MFCVLIVAYKRANLLGTIIQSIPSYVPRIYLQIDLDEENDPRNVEVIELARSLAESNSRIILNIRSSNLGVGLAVPTAIDWAFETCSELMILEDDCIPNQYAFDYFKNNYSLLNKDYIICGTSPFDFDDNKEIRPTSTISKYALISGWMVSGDTWKKISFKESSQQRYINVILKGLKSPNLFIPLSFFYASILRIRNRKVFAWDSILCFSMMINGIKAVIPNVTLISNLGVDTVASNTIASAVTVSNVYRKSSQTIPASGIDFSVTTQRETDALIEKCIYGMGFHNAFSPLKSFIKNTFYPS